MIGNIIQTQYVNNADYPIASALALILMVALMVGDGGLRAGLRDADACRSTSHERRDRRLAGAVRGASQARSGSAPSCRPTSS